MREEGFMPDGTTVVNEDRKIQEIGDGPSR
jgi:hypothetical protein